MISSGRPKVSRFGVTKTATPAWLQHPRRLGDHPLGVGYVLDAWLGDDRAEAGVLEGQLPHVGDHRLPLLALQAPRVDVDPDGLPRGEPVVAVTDAAAQVENPPGAQERLAEDVGRGMALPGGVEAAGRA